MPGSAVLIFRNRRNFGAPLQRQVDASGPLVFHGRIHARVPRRAHSERNHRDRHRSVPGRPLYHLRVPFGHERRTDRGRGARRASPRRGARIGHRPDAADREQPGVREQPEHAVVLLQALFALGIIIGGAHVFVGEVQWVSSEVLHTPAAVVAIILAPLATELPEKFNSVIWISATRTRSRWGTPRAR